MRQDNRQDEEGIDEARGEQYSRLDGMGEIGEP